MWCLSTKTVHGAHARQVEPNTQRQLHDFIFHLKDEIVNCPCVNYNLTNFRCVEILVAIDHGAFSSVQVSVLADAAVIIQCIFSHLGVFLVSVLPAENTKDKTTLKLCKVAVIKLCTHTPPFLTDKLLVLIIGIQQLTLCSVHRLTVFLISDGFQLWRQLKHTAQSEV